MKLKKLFITAVVPALAAGCILAGCSGSQNQTTNVGDQTTTSADNGTQGQAASSGAQEATTVAGNYDSAEKDDKIYNLAEYILSGKPLIRFPASETAGKNDYFWIQYMIKDNKIYDVRNSTADINITYGDYSNMTDDELFDLVLNNIFENEAYPGVLAVFSDKSGNALKSMYFFFKKSEKDDKYVYRQIFDENYIYRSFVVYDSEFIETGSSSSKDYHYHRYNKPIKEFGTLEDYKNMDGVLVDPTDDEIKAALGI